MTAFIDTIHASARIDLSHIDAWVFDLDNTLYPAECNLFAQMHVKMEAFIQQRLGLSQEAARRLHKDYYVRYGTALSGLMRENAIEPGDFLDYVHDIDLAVVEANEALASAIAALPGKRYIFTNGSVKHAENVMARLGVDGLFDAIFDIEAAAYTPKPHRETYERFLGANAIAAKRAAMFEDLAHNLESAHALGMTTVLVCSQAAWAEGEPEHMRPGRVGERSAHVHHVTEDLTDFLGTVITAAATHDDQRKMRP